MSRQANLPGLTRADHGGLGKDFEAALDATHHLYRVQKRADIERNPVEWRYIGKAEFDKLSQISALRPNLAQTLDGRCIQRVKSDVDYGGGGNGRFFKFDAKDTRGKSIPLANFKPHQIQNLAQSERCGNLAGFMLRFSDLNRVFFLKASFVEKADDAARFQRGARKSIALAACEQFGFEIPVSARLVDWLPVLSKL